MLDHGEEQHDNWVPTPPASEKHDESPPSSPGFAPMGRPMVRKRFRAKVPDPLHLDIPHIRRLTTLSNSYSIAVASSIDRADNHKFLEKFRYTIVASQLLSGQSIVAQHHFDTQPREDNADAAEKTVTPTSTGIAITATGALLVAWIISWVYYGGYSQLTKKRVVVAAVILVAGGLSSHVLLRQQWLRYLREQALAGVKTFIARSQDFDSASSAALSLIQEVELVSRGYKMYVAPSSGGRRDSMHLLTPSRSAPLPPISRMEDRSQTRRCVRLRKALRGAFVEMIMAHVQISTVVKEFAEEQCLEKYHDVYDISDFDVQDALQGFSEADFEDPDSLRVLKIAAARFHTIRKILLCCLLAFDATGDNADFLRWSTAVEGLRTLNEVSAKCFERIRGILSEGESKCLADMICWNCADRFHRFPYYPRNQSTLDTRAREATLAVPKA